LGPVATFLLVGFCDTLPEPTAKADKPAAETKPHE
jgi:hypothetical protein